jgi:sphingomyelin phosphodiesterase acid-like 3
MRRLASVLLLFVSPFVSGAPFQSSARARAQALSSDNARQPVISVGPHQGAFLILSDIHFDPFADPSLVPRLAASPASAWSAIFRSSRNNALSRNSRDSSYWLLASAIVAARDSGMGYDYVLVTGDYLAHDFQSKYRAQKLADKDFQAFTIKTITFASRMIQTAFPGTPVFGVLGNNDSTCDDYGESPRSALFSALAGEWGVIASRPDAALDFANGGFYAVPHPTVSKQQLIVLNTTFWLSSGMPDRCKRSERRWRPRGRGNSVAQARTSRDAAHRKNCGSDHAYSARHGRLQLLDAE